MVSNPGELNLLNDSDMLKITQAIYLKHYQMRVLFNDGACRIFDFEPVIRRYPAFKELIDIAKFRSYKVSDTIEWDDRIDIAPEYVYENGLAVNS